MPNGKRVNAVIDPVFKKRLYRVLIEEDLTFSDWIRKQMTLESRLWWKNLHFLTSRIKPVL